MADIGSASLLIVPKFDGLTGKVNSALGAVDASSSGRRIGASLSDGVTKGTGGLLKSGALVGAFSALTAKAMDVMGSHVGSAVARLDTLKNYPVTMHQLGASSEEAGASISLMSDRLQNLPTTLDSMAGTVKGIWAATKDAGVSLDKATRSGLALNDMLLAGGASASVASAAGEQFRQMLAKGKPDMQDWKSLISAAPGQMDQLAKSMLGPTANANDLYKALGGGGGEATISMSQLLDGIVALDEQGGAGLASFSEQAEQATGGIETSAENAANAVTKGLASVMDAIGRDNISGALNDVKGGVNAVFGDLTSMARAAAPVLADVWHGLVDGAKSAYGTLKSLVTALGPVAPAIVGIVAAVKGLGTVRDVLGGLMGGLGGLSGVAKGASDGLLELAGMTSGKLSGGLLSAAVAADGLASVLSGPIGLGVAAAVAVIGTLVLKSIEAQQRMDAARKASEDFVSAARDSDAIGTMAAGMHDMAQGARDATVDIEAYTRTMQAHADAIRSTNEDANAQIDVLRQVQDIIDGSIGKTDLDAAAQGRLKWALQELNAQTGLNISQEDVLAGKYTDQSGQVQDLKSSIDDLIKKRIEEARAAALTSNLTEEYKTQADAAKTMATAQNAYNDQVSQATDNLRHMYETNGQVASTYNTLAQQQGKSVDQVIEDAARMEVAQSDAGKALEQAKGDYDAATDAINRTSDALGVNAAASADGADAYSRLAASMPLLQANMEAAGKSTESMTDTLRSLGVDTDAFANLSNEQLSKLANDYDGTAGSIVGDLRDMGVGMDDAKSRAADLAAALASHMGEGVDKLSATLQDGGISLDEFSAALDNAGVKSSDLKDISSDDFAQMVKSCGGNIDQLVGQIEAYNGLPITDKDGSVTVDSAQLFDAQGRVYTWNGTALVDQYGQAVVGDVSLTTAQGHLYTWNGTTLVPKDGTADVNDVQLVDSQGHLYTWNGSTLLDKDGQAVVTGNLQTALGWVAQWNQSALKSLTGVATMTKNVVTNFVSSHTGQSAWGGVIERRHAAGGVMVDRPGPGVDMRVVRDVVGEDGAEAVVPLNSRHAWPFADMISERIAKGLDSASGGNISVYVDGARVNDDPAIRAAFIDFMGELKRRAAMNVG